MAEISWKPCMTTGNEALDEQHKRFIEIAGTIVRAVRDGSDSRRVAALFSRLREYTVYHFADEERLMRATRYPGLKAHAQDHEELKKQVRHLQERLFRGASPREREVQDFLRRLLVDHVIRADMDFGRFLGENPGPDADSSAA